MKKIKHQPTEKTRSEVEALNSFGVSEIEISSYLGISLEALLENYHKELATSSSKANAEVGRFLFSLASGRAIKDGASFNDCSKAAIFWAKARMNWREGKDFDFLSGGEKLFYPNEIKLIGGNSDDDFSEDLFDDDDES